MPYSKRDIIISVASIVVIIASIFNIVTGATGLGLYISMFVIMMFIIVIAVTLREQKDMN